MANRALVCALLATGPSSISGLPDGDDTEALLTVLDEAGSLSTKTADTLEIRPIRLDALPRSIDARLAGTTSRFLTAVASLSPHEVIVGGDEQLRRRPMAPLHDALRVLGADVVSLGSAGHLPVRVGRRLPTGGEISLAGNVSSQFISSLMLIAPMLNGGLVIRLEGEVVSRSYIDMTARVMRYFGADVHVSQDRVTITESPYEGRTLTIEPDFSSAAFPICAAMARGGRMVVPGLGRAMEQGDSRILEICEIMGGSVARNGDDIVVSRLPHSELHALTMNMSDCSDLVPVVAVLCAAAKGTSHLSGVGFIREKESDRLGDLALELSKIGASARVVHDGLEVDGRDALHHGSIDTHHDHRLAMAFSVAVLKCGSVELDDPTVVSKSWPTFFSDMEPVISMSGLH